METINIKFGGLSNAPSDTMTSDNAIAASLGLVAQGDELIPVADPEVIISSMYEYQKVEYIHTTAGKETYIVSLPMYAKLNLYASTDGKIADLKESFLTIDGLKKITSIGHILIVLDTNGDTHYVLWRNGEYINLGTELPQLEVKASLETVIFDPTQMSSSYGGVNDVGSEVYISSNDTTSGLISTEVCKKLTTGEVSSIALTGDVKMKVGERAIGLVNQYRYILRKNGLFTEPFYVRFAYRLYTSELTSGDYIKHTPPILMVPNSQGKPLFCVNIDENGMATFSPVVTGSSLHYEINTSNISKWADLIQSVDVFITPLITDFTGDIEAVNSLSVFPGHTPNKNGESEDWSISETAYPYMMGKEGQKSVWINVYNKYNESSSEYTHSAFSKSDGERFGVNFKEFTGMRLAVNVLGITDLTLTNTYTWLEVKSDESFNITEENKNTKENKYNLPVGTYKIYYIGKASQIGNQFAFNQDVNGFYVHGPYTDGALLRNAHFLLNIERTVGSYEEDLLEYSNFYKIAEIPISEIKSGEQELVLEKNALLNIEVKDELLDVGQGHKQYKSKEIVAYNSRLSAAIEQETVAPFTSVTAQNSHQNGPTDSNAIKKAYVEITENGQTVYVELKDENINPTDMRYFAYPNRHATKLILFREVSNGTGYDKIVIPLTKHRFLNLSYAFNNFSSIYYIRTSETDSDNYTLPTEGITYTNKIITSSTNNPFHFPENLACIVPTDEVKTISTTTKALSEGQFGQFPLYAFTNDGVWALSVSSEGKYIASQPATRDVCNNIDSITQSDTSLYFTSDRGIIILAGSESLCISDILNDNGDIFDIKALPHWEELTRLCDATAEETQYVPFLDFVKGASLVYDYIHQRLYVYNPTKDYDYAYLYSLTFKKWTITRSNILAKVNSYPDALVNTKDHQYVNLCKDSDTIQKQFLITRPIKLSSPNSLKRIKTIIVHGNFEKGKVSCVLYGSRDMQNWYLIASRKTHEMRNICGTPYKYFRLVVISNLAKGETLSYATLEYESLYNNKLR